MFSENKKRLKKQEILNMLRKKLVAAILLKNMPNLSTKVIIWIQENIMIKVKLI